MKQRDVVLPGWDESGNSTLDFPITRLGNIENGAEDVDALDGNDYVAIAPATGGRFKRARFAKILSAIANAVSGHNDSVGAHGGIKNTLDTHTADTTAHITAAERAKWNAAADTPLVSDKVLQYGDTNGEAGKFDKQTTAPTVTTNPLRYNGIFRATRVYGMYYSPDADVAELYPVEGEIEPGELVMICADGVFRRNIIAGNPRVLGIVSTAPAMLLGDGGSGVPIALCGRVPVKVNGKVTAGDLLCGAATPGLLARAGDDVSKGAIVAQALESGKDGVITALVLRL